VYYGWFNENTNRAYPFVKGTTANLPKEAIVDCGFVVGVLGDYEADVHDVHLESITRTGSNLFFQFIANSSTLFNRPILFTRAITDEDYVTEYIDSGPITLIGDTLTQTFTQIEEAACGEAAWYGFLTTGRLASLLTLLPGNGTLNFEPDELIVEPALVQNLTNSLISSLNVANSDRLRVTTSDDCTQIEWPFETGGIFVDARCLEGSVAFRPGFNVEISIDTTNNALLFSAVPGGGEGQPCTQVPIFEGEEPPEDSLFLEGGVACNEVLRSINGQGGPRFSFFPGTGVTIISVPESNTVVVDADLSGLVVCDTITDITETV